MKRLFLFILLFYPILTWADTDFIVHHIDGTQTVYVISEYGGIYIDNDKLLISEFYGSKTEEPIANIRKITFANYPVGMENIDTEKEQIFAYPNPTHGEIYLHGIDNDTPISLYSLDGQKILDNITLPQFSTLFSPLKSGIYILQVNNQTLKICKL